MKKLTTEENKKVVAGSISGTLVNALNKTFDKIFEVGHNLGSAIKRLFSGNTCSL